jgi:hypothetical protein
MMAIMERNVSEVHSRKLTLEPVPIFISEA